MWYVCDVLYAVTYGFGPGSGGWDGVMFVLVVSLDAL